MINCHGSDDLTRLIVRSLKDLGPGPKQLAAYVLLWAVASVSVGYGLWMFVNPLTFQTARNMFGAQAPLFVLLVGLAGAVLVMICIALLVATLHWLRMLYRIRLGNGSPRLRRTVARLIVITLGAAAVAAVLGLVIVAVIASFA